MHEAGGHPRLLDEHLLDLRVPRVLGKDAFDGIEILGPVRPFAAGAVDLSHTALGMEVQDLESGNHNEGSIAARARREQSIASVLRRRRFQVECRGVSHFADVRGATPM